MNAKTETVSKGSAAGAALAIGAGAVFFFLVVWLLGYLGVAGGMVMGRRFGTPPPLVLTVDGGGDGLAMGATGTMAPPASAPPPPLATGTRELHQGWNEK